MHVRIIHQYFKTPEEGGGMRTYFLARELIKRGIKVSVITATNQNKAANYEYEGINIHALPIYYSNHLKFYSRISVFIRYVLRGFALLRNLPPADVNYIVTTPLTTGIIGLMAKRLLRQPYVFEVGDLWPDAPIALGVLNNPILVKLSRELEDQSYNHASGLIGLSPPITKYLTSRRPETPAITVTNFSVPEYADLPDSKELREELGISPDAFVIGYIGTIGLANHLEYLVNAMTGLDNRFHCVIMGTGARLNSIRAMAEKSGARITCIPHGGQADVQRVLGIVQAVYVSFADVDVLNTGCPNKFFDGLAAGKVLITNFQGWLAELLAKEGIGFSYDPHQPSEFQQKIKSYLPSEVLTGIRMKGLELAQKKYSPEKQVNILETFLKKVVEL